ncbi:hypothetical protein [Shinella sp.]|uniref:hypothetical protein n=1 Tax=Shinella sp. TaxID=1870904 RepID=UPI0028A696C5|nr:hypothetical protein [Shinella sp.]
MNWQPIESAPVGRTVLVWADYMDEPELGVVGPAGRVREVDPEWGSEIYTATHWMSLPEPPEDTTQVDDGPEHMPAELIAYHPEGEFNEPAVGRLVVKRGQNCVVLSAQEIVELVGFVCESSRLRDVVALLPPLPESLR